MKRYLMSVFGPAEYKEYGNYPSEEAMKQALADTGVFNQRLQEEGYWVFADGLAPATTATVQLLPRTANTEPSAVWTSSWSAPLTASAARSSSAVTSSRMRSRRSSSSAVAAATWPSLSSTTADSMSVDSSSR